MKCFELLGLPDDANEREVRLAYRQLAHKMHPDKGGNADDFRSLNQAYGEAVLAVTNRVCTSCKGSGRITVQHGWTASTVMCVTCMGGGR